MQVFDSLRLRRSAKITQQDWKKLKAGGKRLMVSAALPEWTAKSPMAKPPHRQQPVGLEEQAASCDNSR
jgi:hypothetical protein